MRRDSSMTRNLADIEIGYGNRCTITIPVYGPQLNMMCELFLCVFSRDCIH